jgi:predicted aspartyl protease
MSHFSVMIGSDGPTIDLAVAVGRAWQRRLATQGISVPSPSTVRALIDTGSDLSVVHPQVLQQLGVQATGSVRIRRPGAEGGFRLAAMFDIQLSIGGVSSGTLWLSTQVVGVVPSTPTVLALIGRDVLEHCTQFYNGPRGELTLSL